MSEDEDVDINDFVEDLENSEDSQKDDSSTGNFIDDYFDDDENFLAGDDESIELEDGFSILKQYDGIVSWRIEGLYDDNGKMKSSIQLRNNPPILIIEDSSDNGEVTFVLSKNFSKELHDATGIAYRAFFGMKPVSKDSIFTRDGFISRVDNLSNWIVENKIKAGFLLVLTVLAVLFLFVF